MSNQQWSVISKQISQELSFFTEWGCQIYKKLGSQNCDPQYFDDENFTTPSTINTPYPLHRLKLNKINTISVVIFLHFGNQKFYNPTVYFFQKTPPGIFLSKDLWPPVYFGPLIPKKMITHLQYTLFCETPNFFFPGCITLGLSICFTYSFWVVGGTRLLWVSSALGIQTFSW